MATIRPLAPELAEVARTELNENENNIQQDIEEFRTWIQQQAYLKARIDDQYLVAFLRFCKYDMVEAKKRLVYFYTYKTQSIETFKARVVDSKVLGICNAGIFGTLTKPLGEGGPRIHFTRMGKIDTSMFSVHDIFRFHMMRCEMNINIDDNWIISGVVEIIDFSKIPFSLLRQFEPNLFRKMAAYLEFGVPTNLRGTHIVNASREAQLILNLVRLAMRQKELLHIHSTLESLHEAIGKEYLPSEYGGSNGTLDEASANLEKNFQDFKDYFVEDENYGCDAKLKESEENKSTSGNAGGSLRKMNFD